MKTEDCFKEGFLKKIPSSVEKARCSIQIAESFVKKAVKNIDITNYDVAIVVAYAAMFHSFRSILFRDGIKERSHVCLINYIRNNYKELESLANDIDSYRRFRHTALYGLDDITTKEEAENAVNVARRSISTIAEMIT